MQQRYRLAMAAVAGAAVTAMLGITVQAYAAGEPTLDKVKAGLKKTLGDRVDIKGVEASPVPGLYEVNLGPQIIYTDASGRYILSGELIDTQTGTNLTEARLADLNKIKWSDLPLQQAIKWTKGDGSRKMAVFADPNCGYCKRIEHTFQQMDNVTVYTFLFPILSPDSTTKSKQIWCSADKAKAWRDWMVNQTALNGKGECTTPLQQNLALGKSLNVTGTPAVFFADGSRIPGAADQATLERKLASLKK
jgi:thiol:disulfide interchange protein DsbC